MENESLDFEISDGPFIYRMIPTSQRALITINRSDQTYVLADDLTIDEAKRLIGQMMTLYFEIRPKPMEICPTCMHFRPE